MQLDASGLGDEHDEAEQGKEKVLHDSNWCKYYIVKSNISRLIDVSPTPHPNPPLSSHETMSNDLILHLAYYYEC